MEAPERKQVGPQTVAFIRRKAPYSDIGGVYLQLFAWARRANVKPTGPPFTCFLDRPEDLDWASARFEVCLPVAKGTVGSGEVRVKELPATDVLAVVVQGPYSEIPPHYAELLAWMSVVGGAPAGPPREVYLVHPAPDGSGDPKTFRTEIQFPVSD